MIRFSSACLALILGFGSFCAHPGVADEPKDAPRGAASVPLNVATATMGGKQLWTDEMVWHGWRIQRNAWTGHYRLLDDADVRQMWGTWEQCRERWEQLRVARSIPRPAGRVVVLVHGLGRSRAVMAPLGNYLREKGGYTIVNVTYASTQDDIEGHARSLARVLENLEGVAEVHFVGHSLGNIVLRHYLQDQAAGGDMQRACPPIGRIVMLGPPNQGAELAKRMKELVIFHWVTGAAGRELGVAWDQLVPKLATPKVEFGIVAGGRGDGDGRNPLVRGDDDLVVSVEETKLAGAADFIVAPVTHRQLLTDPLVHEYAFRFLQHGYFRPDGKRQPLAK